MEPSNLLLMKFSKFEIKEIVKAWIAVSLIFAIAFRYEVPFVQGLPISLFTAGLGFVLHEMAHKWVAQRYNKWAEFRANNQALLLGLALSFVGFIIAAPGGVFIKGATPEQHGKIAFAGPLMNIILAAVFMGVGFLLTGMPAQIAYYGHKINALLAVFNLIPFPPMDGFSVFRWNKVVWVTGIAASALLLLL